MDDPYRTPVPPPEPKKKSLLCKIGYHRRAVIGITASGRIIEQCKGCDERTVMTLG